MIGEKYNKLTVIAFSHKDKRGRRFYKCLCDCGTERFVQQNALKTGNTKSCGCIKKDIAKARRLPDNLGVVRHLILQYKRHATERNISFYLTEEQFNSTIRLPCHYCGTTGGNLAKNKNCKEGFAYNGIDRLDANLPYTTGNIVAACGKCNIAKQDMSELEFLDLICKIYKHRGYGVSVEHIST